MAVKLPIEIYWITNLNNLEKSMVAMNSRIQKMSKAFTKGYSLLGSPERTEADIAALEKYDKIFNKLYIDYEKMNKTGKLSSLWRALTGYKPTGKGGVLSPQELTQYVSSKTWQEVERYAAKQRMMDYATQTTSPSYRAYKSKLGQAKKEEYHLSKEMSILERDAVRRTFALRKANLKAEEREKLQAKRNEEEKAAAMASEEKRNIKMNRLHAQALEENKKRDEALRKKHWNLLLGKWGKLGIWGVIAQKAIGYISKGVSYAYSTSMQGLDWERTIRGGAAGGSWFGQGLAAYQRAGIGAANYQNFKRGVQGYLGQVKLGMGNAAPLMYLGLNALGKPDELERQLERSLRRLPEDVSLALSQQMGLDYNMWEAIYSGRLDREKSSYSEEAIQKWSEVADRINDMLTSFKVFGFEKLANLAYNITHPEDVIKHSGWFGALGFLANGLANPQMAITQALIKLGTLDIVIKNDKGEVIDTQTKEIDNTVFQYTGQS